MMLSAKGPACEEMEAQKIDYVIWPLTEVGPMSFVLRFIKSLNFFSKRRVDLISLTYGCLGWRPAELLAARLARIPVVQHCQRVVRNPSPFARHSDLILASSDYVRLKSAFAPNRVCTLYDLVDIERFGNGTDLRAELGISKDRFVITYLGRQRKAKGIDIFVEMIQRISNPELTFVIATQRAGNRTSDAYSDEDFRRIVESDSRIIHIDFREDVENLYATSDVVVMPSLEPEPSPAVVLETAASGKPIVATDTGSTRELVIPGETGLLVAPNDADELMYGVTRLIKDTELRSRLGRNAKARAATTFFQASLSQMHNFYAKLLTWK